MAKKKRKRSRRPTTRPATAAGGTTSATTTPTDDEEAQERTERPKTERKGRKAEAPVSNRQARKEAARRERERRIRAARRRARIRRAVRWGLVLAVGLGIAGFVWLRTTESRRVQDAAAAAAQTLDCTEIEDFGPRPGGQHLQPGQPPPPYETTPATFGMHAGGTYQGPAVISNPVDPVLETSLVHNLEHAYVVIYYRPAGEGALPAEVRTDLAGLAESEDKVILAPYPSLQEGQSLALTAWAKLQTCPEIPADEGEAVLSVTRGFIDQFRGGGDAPEPAAA
jgi:hypothetical protein